MESPPDPDRRARRRAHVLAVALAGAHLAWALVAGQRLLVGSFDSAADFYAVYAPGARDLLSGRPYLYARSGPGYSALLAALHLAGLDWFAAAKLVAACGTTAIGYLTFQLGRTVWGAGVALLAQLLVQVTLLRYALVAGNDIPCAALSLASLALLYGRDRPGPGRLAAAGLAGAAACATRFPAAAVLATGALALAGVFPARLAWKARARNLLAFGAGAALVLAPWLGANWRWHGTPLHNRTHALIALEVFGAPSEQVDQARLAEMERRFSSLGEVIAHDPGAFLGHYAFDFYRDVGLLLGDSVTFPAHLFLGAGLLWTFARGARRRVALGLAAYAALAFALVALAPYQARYHYPILFVLDLWVAAGLWGRWSREVPEDRALRRARVACTAIVLAVAGAASAVKTREYLADDPREVLPSAEVLREVGQEGEAVVCRKGHVAFLGGLAMQPLAVTKDLDGFLAWLRRDSGATFLYVGPREVATDPFLAPLARGQDRPDWLEPLHRSEQPPSSLYRIRLEGP